MPRTEIAPGEIGERRKIAAHVQRVRRAAQTCRSVSALVWFLLIQLLIDLW
jgi:hypothetical protein